MIDTDAPIETSEAEARPYRGPVQMIEPEDAGAAPMPTTLSGVMLRAKQLTADLHAEQQHTAARQAAIRGELAEVFKAQQNILAGVNADTARRAEALLQVGGLYAEAGDDRDHAVQKAIDQLLIGGGALMTDYVGTKNFAHWRGQFIACGYGLGPKHGSTCFSIGLQPQVRQRKQRPALTPAEVDACLYYLHNLAQIQESAAVAKARAGVN